MDDSRPLRWLYLDLNSYFASVEQQLDPRLRGRPVVVAPVDTDSTSAIAASYEAKAYGIRTGTKIWEAKAKCRDLIVVPGQHEHYVRFHHRIIEEVGRHVPVYAVCSIDEVACRLLDNENSEAAVRRIAAAIKAGIRANVGECLTSSIGVAPNRLLAKMAADMQKPDGLTIVPAEAIDGRLKALKLNDIPGVGRNMEARLAAAGVVTMERLLQLDARQARQAWGSVWGERMFWLLQGQELPELETVNRSIGHSHVLGPDKRPLAAARLVTRRLLAKAATRLRRAEKRCSRLGLSVKLEAARGEKPLKWSAEVRLPPVMDTPALLHALEGLWNRMTGELAARRLLQVGVVLADLTAADAVQPGLFDAGAVRDERRALALSQAMDKVNARFGRDAVTMGHDRMGAVKSSGPRIAFTRIPELAEFRE
ncbi:DNA polymerase IV [Polymorphobacter multimanifer]|uniref:DNA-directed DNA polymerase n=1 Tax=Polymorphobacter multimanifer TaxID=1070431 RepID=A0A841L230_9SPHN|nr:type VI secretion protein ImpB [Polymorphobacter multimanifer]MBB6226644.1 DNA polymerase-4 [Polymorphobacter multimanifer]GGI69168.1 DNA polymerase IV [Polymorphobacter multimanifer]